MSKPIIIGYQFDYTRYDAPQMPEITVTGDGEMTVQTIGRDFDGHLYERPRVIEPDQVDAFMRYYGCKPQYAPRKFRARRVKRGYLLTCRDCGISRPCIFPHDAANEHMCGRA